MPHIAPLAERRARYERLLAMTKPVAEGGQGMTYEAAGAVFGIERQRVYQILAKPPRKPGPPYTEATIEALNAKLKLWGIRRAARVEKGKPTTVADERIRAITAELAEVQDAMRT